MASIRKRGSRWQVQVRRRGYAAISRSFGRKADALTWARQIEAEVDRRGLPADPKTLENVSLADVIRRYRDTVVAGKRSRDVEAVILNAFLRTEVAALPLARLTPARLAQYRDTRLQVVKPATINRELGGHPARPRSSATRMGRTSAGQPRPAGAKAAPGAPARPAPTLR